MRQQSPQAFSEFRLCWVLVHGWDRSKNLNSYSLLALRTHKNVKFYPTMTKGVVVENDSERFHIHGFVVWHNTWAYVLKISFGGIRQYDDGDN